MAKTKNAKFLEVPIIFKVIFMKQSLPKLNLILIAVSFVIIIIGFALMVGAPSGEEYNPDIFSTRRITVGPMISLFGFVFMIEFFIHTTLNSCVAIDEIDVVEQERFNINPLYVFWCVFDVKFYFLLIHPHRVSFQHGVLGTQLLR